MEDLARDELYIISHLTKGRVAPDLSGVNSGGEPMRLSDHKGKLVVVNYFATWCPPCIAEIPDLEELQKEFAPRGVVFIAISMDRTGERPDMTREQVLEAFLKQHAFTWPILLPPADHPLWRTEFPIPQTYLYDRQGRKARSILGGVGGQGVKASLEELLKEL